MGRWYQQPRHLVKGFSMIWRILTTVICSSLNVRRPRLSMSSFSSTHRSSFFFLHMIAAFISSCRCASRIPSTPEVLGVSSSWGCSHDASTFCLPYPASVRPPVKSLHRRQITSLQQMSQLHQYRRLFIVRLEKRILLQTKHHRGDT